ncbi:RNA polymerase sigma factor [Streptomyces sp. NPDC090088]|uniref:RNA polymerase sigma factor n=1 Tax=Streptomyces sp. NPDC090088 TaxID=3365944 RepID=UPI0037F1F16C
MNDGESWFAAYFRQTYDVWIGWAGRAGVRDAGARHDIVQQAFKELWLAWDGVDRSTSSLNAFMCVRVKSRVIDRWREKKQRPEVSASEFLDELGSAGHPLGGLCSDRDWAAEMDRRKWFGDLISSLGDVDRSHVLLVALGAAPKERAEILGLSPGNERVRWHRLKERIKWTQGHPGRESGRRQDER